MSLFPASYSKLSTYETCARKAFFRYIEQLGDPKSPQMERGSKLHASAEAFLLGEKKTVHKDLVSIANTLRKVKSKNPIIEHKIALEAGLETVVPWDSPKAWFRMVLDSAYKEGDQGYVQEWKSGKIYDDHADQRHTYGSGLLLLWPELVKVEVTTYYIDQGKTRSVHIDPPRATVLRWHLKERLEVMESDKDFAPRPGYYCGWCSFSRLKGGPCKVG